jgi:hypothetical protein
MDHQKEKYFHAKRVRDVLKSLPLDIQEGALVIAAAELWRERWGTYRDDARRAAGETAAANADAYLGHVFPPFKIEPRAQPVRGDEGRGVGPL